MRLLLIFAGTMLVACSASNGTTIQDVQGDTAASPLDGQAVTVEGVVTGDFQDDDTDSRRNLGGFYIQNPPDGNDETSDGIFVFDGNSPATDVVAGDRVRVQGTVKEHYGETQIGATAVIVTGSGTVQPTPANLPTSATVSNSDGELIADLERYEGMLVRFPQTLTVNQLRNQERFGEVLLSEGGRQYSFTNRSAPDVAGYDAHLQAVASRRIHLDDGLRNHNPGTALLIRNGDEITDLTGVLRYSRGSGSSGTETYRLMPTTEPQFDSNNPRPDAPQVNGELRIASFNLNNYFSTVDNGRSICGPAGDDRCRGADSKEELSRQLGKITTVVSMLNADIVAMIELENNARESLQTIVDGLNAAEGAGTYAFVDTGTIGNDAVKVGLLYRPAAVQPTGAFAILDGSVDVRFDHDRNRPVLAQTFVSVANGEQLTIVTNHLKSKGSNCNKDDDPDLGDGQSDCSATRAMAAAAMIDWIVTDPTSSGNSDFLIIGDFNTHTMGDALMLFENAGYTNVAETFIGDSAYSFEFDGQFGSLDHALASPSLAPQVVDAMEWRINADESRLNDYNLESGRDPTLFDPTTPYRASDHDPLIIGIDFSE